MTSIPCLRRRENVYFTRDNRPGERGAGERHRVVNGQYTCTRDEKATVVQVKELEEDACELVRVAVPDASAVG